MRNHTSTHLLNWALRRVLGDHIDQKGSLVDAEKLRFDFSHPQALTVEQMTQVERLVNEKIYSDLPVSATVMSLADAKKIAGVRAVFGEKYPDPVRVIAVGVADPHQANTEHSIEFCGGTHLSRTGEAGFFKIIAEEAVSKGVRRVTAVTGRGAVEHVQKLEMGLRHVQQALSSPVEEAPRRIAALQDEIRQLKKKLQGGGGGVQEPKAFADAALQSSTGPLVVAEYKGAAADQMLSVVDSIRKRRDSYAILLGAVADDKVNFVAAVSDDLIAKGLKAGDWVRDTAKIAGGGGGGRPQLAQAGGKEADKLPEALHAAREIASRWVS